MRRPSAWRMQVDLAVAQDHPRHQPAAFVAVPGELEHGLAEHRERPARVGPRRIGDAHAFERRLGRERVAEAEAHLVEMDLASRGLAEVGGKPSPRATTDARASAASGSTSSASSARATAEAKAARAATRRRRHRGAVARPGCSVFGMERNRRPGPDAVRIRQECRLLAETTDIEDPLHEQQPRAKAGPDRQRLGRRRRALAPSTGRAARMPASPIRSARRCPTWSPARSKATRRRPKKPAPRRSPKRDEALTPD